MLKPWHSFKLIGAFRDLGFWRTPVALGKMRLAYPFFDGFIANSHAVKDFFAHADRLCADNIEVIHNGIEITERRGALVDVDGNHTPLIGIVANCNRHVKRVDDFIRTAHLVHRKLPEARFMVVGDGEMRQELQQLSRSLGLEEVLTFTGRVTNPLDFIRRFDVGVITSETEGLCNAILEYMAFGVPVVATAAGGNPELVKDGENGYLLPIGDIEQMAEKICLLLQNKSLHSRIHFANLQKVTDDFSLSRMIAKHEAFYERILGG
jgi:glycosyltransferase involved in cell wall biosynthesis